MLRSTSSGRLPSTLSTTSTSVLPVMYRSRTDSENWSVLTATENGYGKRTPIAEYTRHGRGTKGMIAIQTSERNGKVVAAVLTAQGETNEEIMLISTGGVLIRTRIADIREMSRATQGVTLINLDAGTLLAGVEKVVETEDSEPIEEGE